MLMLNHPFAAPAPGRASRDYSGAAFLMQLRARASSIAMGLKYDRRAAGPSLFWQGGRCRLTLWGDLLWRLLKNDPRFCRFLQLLCLSGSRLAWVHDDRDGGQTCHCRKYYSVHANPSQGLKSRSRAFLIICIAPGRAARESLALGQVPDVRVGQMRKNAGNGSFRNPHR
jgi:hypothetical protein